MSLAKEIMAATRCDSTFNRCLDHPGTKPPIVKQRANKTIIGRETSRPPLMLAAATHFASAKSGWTFGRPSFHAFDAKPLGRPILTSFSNAAMRWRQM